MRLTRREFAAASLAAAALPGLKARAEEVHRSHGTSLAGELKYGPDFPHFDHTNPDAPKGGVARLASQGGFDSFNPHIIKGDPPPGINALLYERLMTGAPDESSAEYGLVAEWIEHPADFSWVAFRLRDEARWHDGRPITPADAIFSFRILTTKGHPFYRKYYQNVTEARDMGDRVVRFDFDTANNRELPHIMGQLELLPAHWWEGRAFDESGLEPLLGSGPYRIGAFEPGRFIEYERVSDHWAKDLPVNRGRHNFDRIRYEIFLDAEAAFEGFKSGAFDYREENSAKKWAQQYDFPAVRKGLVKREELVTQGPKTVQTFAFNLRRKKFQDRRVREAIGLAFDFERTNETVFFGQYARPRSYFQGTESLMPEGAPEGAELAMLEALRGQVPEEVFGSAWEPPQTDGSGRNRRQLRRASQLLSEAGYEVRGGRLVTPEGEPFEIEFLTASDAQERVVNPFLQNLRTLGFDASLRIVDGPQYLRRVAQDPEFDWDMIVSSISNSDSPGNEQRDWWGSTGAMVVGARNFAGVSDPAVDALIDRIIFAKDRAELEAASRALDRVLTWNFYAIPELYTPFERIAWWDRFGHPDPLPPYGPGFPSLWWWDEDKAARVEAAR